jgi:uncharacterized RDD family membrane protein YckC
VSTNDWKAELRRRIESIREKKETEREVRRRTTVAAVAAVVPNEDTEEDEEEPHADERPFEVVQSRVIAKQAPAKTEEVERRLESASYAVEDPTPSDAAPLHEMEDLTDETETEEPELDLKEPTLFPVRPVVKIHREKPKPVAAVEDRKQPEVKSAAPAASDLEAALDNYIPLDHNPASEEAAETKPEGLSPAAEEPEVPRELLTRRLLAVAFDAIFLLASEALIVLTAGALMERDALQLLFGSLPPLALMFGFFHFLYYVIFTALTGQTPGKVLFGVKVTTRGKSAGIGPIRALLRWLALIGSLLPLGAGYFWIFAKPYGWGWHDILTGTNVERV